MNTSALHRNTFAVVGLLAGISATTVAYGRPNTPEKSVADLNAEFKAAVTQLQPVLKGRDLSSATDRQALVAANAAPAVRRVVAALDALAPAVPDQKAKLLNQKASYEGLLYALGDSETIAATDAAAKTADSADARLAQAVTLRSQWIIAGPKDVAGRTAVVEKLATLAAAHPEDELLTLTAFTLMQQAADPTQQSRLKSLVTDTMKNDTSTKLTAYLSASAAPQPQPQPQPQAQAATTANAHAALEQKPMTISGVSLDGQTFSTDKWKGKVVLVDFWATWCGPCKRELPRVKQMYEQYHDKGLEVLGVSLDVDARALNSYLATAGMPWPELFDAESAATRKPNPVAVQYKVDSIPLMFLIDKKGVCRSVSARDDMETLIPKLLSE